MSRLLLRRRAHHRPGAEELREAGFSAYLLKPVHQSDLMNVLAAAWAGRGDSQRLPVTRPPRASADAEAVAVAQGLRVLVVEDDAVNQRVAQIMLTDLEAHAGPVESRRQPGARSVTLEDRRFTAAGRTTRARTAPSRRSPRSQSSAGL